MDYKTRQRIHEDKEQTVLSDKGCLPNPFIFAQKEDKHIYDMIVLCPFCLYSGKLYLFDKKRYNLRMCPDCKTEMQLSSLTRFNNVAEFAKWVFDYRLNGFWDKVKPTFELWNKKLYELGLSYEFWQNYKRLRGDNNQKWEDSEESED